MDHPNKSNKAPGFFGQLVTIANTDYCPWANKFVYWLKEPLGWLVSAAAVCVLVGLYLNPFGWTLAVALLCVCALGMIWPVIAVFAARCELTPASERAFEEEEFELRFSVSNPLPIPMIGLAIEGYLDLPSPDGIESNVELTPTVALSWVAPVSTSEYRIKASQDWRGHYPHVRPVIGCSFPFGIWTARRRLKHFQNITIWPRMFPVLDKCPWACERIALDGEGQQGGNSEDFSGLRPFRYGDTAKQVNWIATAKTDTLVVTERCGPQTIELNVHIDTHSADSREVLARRIRIATSVLMNLLDSRISLRVSLGNRMLSLALSNNRQDLLDALAEIPLDGTERTVEVRQISNRSRIDFLEGSNGGTIVRGTLAHATRGRSADSNTFVIDEDTTAEQLLQFWMRLEDRHAMA